MSSTTRIVLPGSQWEVQEDEALDLVERLQAAADEGKALAIRVVDDAGEEGVVVVAPAAVPVVVTGVRRRDPSQSFPQH